MTMWRADMKRNDRRLWQTRRTTEVETMLEDDSSEVNGATDIEE